MCIGWGGDGVVPLLWVSVVEGEMFCCVCALVQEERGLFHFGNCLLLSGRYFAVYV